MSEPQAHILDFRFEILQHTFYDRMIEWRERHISEKHLVLLLSFFVGAFSAAAAGLLKSFIHIIQQLVEGHLIAGGHTWWYLITPVIGITLAALFVKYIVRDDISHGITKILYAISQRKSIIKPHNMWSSVVGSGLTIGFGGSVGAEAPIVLTGAAIGSNLAKAFRLNQKTMMLMIGCGAAGAIGGIFKAPIAGLVFTLEVLMMDLTMTSVAPLLISSVTATAISYLLTGVDPMFPIAAADPFLVKRIPWYLILGAICGLVSLYFTRGMNHLEQWMKHSIQSMWGKLLVGGAMLSMLIFLFPPLYGEGYDVIRQLINGDCMTAIVNSPLSQFLSFHPQLGSNEWSRRRGRYLRTFALHGCNRRFCHGATDEYVGSFRIGGELRAGRYGGFDVGCDACAADGYLPDCGVDGWLPSFHAADDRECDLISDDYAVRAPLAVRYASGAER